MRAFFVNRATESSLVIRHFALQLRFQQSTFDVQRLTLNIQTSAEFSSRGELGWVAADPVYRGRGLGADFRFLLVIAIMAERRPCV